MKAFSNVVRKTAMHLFFATFGFGLLNTLHIVMESSTLSAMIGYNNWFEFLNRQPLGFMPSHTKFGKNTYWLAGFPFFTQYTR